MTATTPLFPASATDTTPAPTPAPTPSVHPTTPNACPGLLVYRIIPTTPTVTKFYGVRIGENIGIYLSWGDCHHQVTGFSGNCYQKFGTFQQAAAFVWGVKWREMAPWYLHLGGKTAAELGFSEADLIRRPDSEEASGIPSSETGHVNTEDPALAAEHRAAEDAACYAAAMQSPPNVFPYAKRSVDLYPESLRPGLPPPPTVNEEDETVPTSPAKTDKDLDAALDNISSTFERLSVNSPISDGRVATLTVPPGLTLNDSFVAALPLPVRWALRKCGYSPESIRIIAAVANVYADTPTKFAMLLAEAGMDNDEALELWSDIRLFTAKESFMI